LQGAGALDKYHVARYSPTLADKIAVFTNEGLDRVVGEILKVVRKAKIKNENAISTDFEEDVNQFISCVSAHGEKFEQCINKSMERWKILIAERAQAGLISHPRVCRKEN